MRSDASKWNTAVILSVAAFLSFVARAFIDYGFVYRELYPSIRSIGILTLVYLGFIAGWLWALLAASHKTRQAMYALLIYGAIILLHAGVTLVVFCRFPCQTAWPVGQVFILASLLSGIAAVVAAVLSLRQKVV
jgi:hypothetical protein